MRLALCGTLTLQLGLPAIAAAAEQVQHAPGRVPSPIAAPQLVLPHPAAGLASAAAPQAAQAAAPAAVPAAAAAAELRALPVAELAAPQAGDESRQAAGLGFDTRAPGQWEALAADVAAANALRPHAALLARAAARAPGRRTTVPAGAERQSSYAPFAVTIAVGLITALVAFTASFVTGLPAPDAAPAAGWLVTAASVAVWTTLGATAVSIAASAADAGMFVYAMLRGAGKTEDDLLRFVRAEAAAGRLDASMIGVIRAFEPEVKERWKGLTYAFAAGGFIYMRPELVASPGLFRWVLAHEYSHVERVRERGPPRGVTRRLLERVASETTSYWRSFQKLARGVESAAEIRVPTLERVLRQTQMSMKLERPYDMLVVNPGSKDLTDAALYKGLSGGNAKLETLESAEPQAALAERARRYGAVVLDQAGASLPPQGSEDHRKLGLALRQLESLHVLASRGIQVAESGFGPSSSEERLYKDLAEKLDKLGGVGTKAAEPVQEEVRKLWREVASNRLKGLPARALTESLYGSLRNKGLAFLTFRPGDPGVAVWERLLRYWEAADGGHFRASRVDLEDGSHVIAMRKVEDRKVLWLTPHNSVAIDKSVPDANSSPEMQKAAREALVKAGFGPQLEQFDKLGVEIEHVFGKDVGRQLIAISATRAGEKALRRMGSENGVEHVEPPAGGYETHLTDVPGLLRAKGAWSLGFTGDEKVMVIGTGSDETHEHFAGRLEAIDLTREGKQDFNGHDTVVAAILGSSDSEYTGLAPHAQIISAKVFGRDMMASDGPIMAAGAIGHSQRGVRIINASLGMMGSSATKLAMFFSDLTEKPNVNGDYILFVGSAGNSGPVDRTLSSPGVARRGLTVAAATKSEDDGRPEISFYSSVGPDYEQTAAGERLFLKPDITCIGGDVTTSRDNPNIYEHGVNAAKSKDMPPSPSDKRNRRVTAMSGTSMAAPACAGIAADVLTALKRTKAIDGLDKKDVPWALKAILMATARDMGVPVWFQGAGLADAKAAVDLVREAAGGGLRASLAMTPGFSWTAGKPREGAFDWVKRYKAVVELEDSVYQSAELAKIGVQARLGRGLADDAETPPEAKDMLGNAVALETGKTIAEQKAAALPKLLQALKDPSWLVRRQAALALLNLKLPDAAMPLAERALDDPDARVRQMAFMALARTPGHAVDILLQKASLDKRPDVGLFAAYALAARGDLVGLPRVVAEMSSPDKATRFSATWLLGQLDKRAVAVHAEAISAKVAQPSERGDLRHLGAAALTNVAKAAPDALTPKVVADLLGAAGLDNLALTRTIEKVFPIAAANSRFVERLKAEPLRSLASDFVQKNKAAATKTGALTDLVLRLAKLLEISLEEPTPQPDPQGRGVAGVDPLLGPLDLIVHLPQGAARPDPARLAQLEAQVRSELPLSAALWVSVPEHKLYAFAVEMERLGLPMRLPAPRYSAARRGPRLAEEPGIVLDLARAAALPPDADLSVVRVRAGEGASEARVVAALEAIAAAARPLEKPTVVSLDAVAPAVSDHESSLVTALASRLVAGGIEVVAPAGNEGPRAGTLAAPRSWLAVVVGAAARASGLQPYSGRGEPGEAPIRWIQTVDELSEPAGAQGTGEAAERSAVKLAALSRRAAEAFRRAGRPLPQGLQLLVRETVEQSLAPLRGLGPHDVGGGLFADEPGLAEARLDASLRDLDAAAARAAWLLAAARRRLGERSLPGGKASVVPQAAAAALQQALSGPVSNEIERWTSSVR